MRFRASKFAYEPGVFNKIFLVNLMKGVIYFLQQGDFTESVQADDSIWTLGKLIYSNRSYNYIPWRTYVRGYVVFIILSVHPFVQPYVSGL